MLHIRQPHVTNMSCNHDGDGDDDEDGDNDNSTMAIYFFALFRWSDYIIGKFVVLCTKNSETWWALQKM